MIPPVNPAVYPSKSPGMVRKSNYPYQPAGREIVAIKEDPDMPDSDVLVSIDIFVFYRLPLLSPKL